MARTPKDPTAPKTERKPVKRLPAACLPIVRLGLDKMRMEIQNAADHPLVNRAQMLADCDKAIAHFAHEDQPEAQATEPGIE